VQNFGLKHAYKQLPNSASYLYIISRIRIDNILDWIEFLHRTKLQTSCFDNGARDSKFFVFAIELLLKLLEKVGEEN
jgi:hypothetical protein